MVSISVVFNVSFPTLAPCGVGGVGSGPPQDPPLPFVSRPPHPIIVTPRQPHRAGGRAVNLDLHHFAFNDLRLLPARMERTPKSPALTPKITCIDPKSAPLPPPDLNVVPKSAPQNPNVGPKASPNHTRSLSHHPRCPKCPHVVPRCPPNTPRCPPMPPSSPQTPPRCP